MRTLLTTLKERIPPIWTAAMRQFECSRQWLTRPRDPIDWKAIRTNAGSRLTPKSMASRAVTVGILIVILVAVAPWLWKIYSNNLPSIIPLGAVLSGTHLERANLSEVHLEDADLFEAHLEDAILAEAHLGGADLRWAHLERANLSEAHLGGADLREAHLGGADLRWAHLERADLCSAHLQ